MSCLDRQVPLILTTALERLIWGWREFVCGSKSIKPCMTLSSPGNHSSWYLGHPCYELMGKYLHIFYQWRYQYQPNGPVRVEKTLQLLLVLEKQDVIAISVAGSTQFPMRSCAIPDCASTLCLWYENIPQMERGPLTPFHSTLQKPCMRARPATVIFHCLL